METYEYKDADGKVVARGHFEDGKFVYESDKTKLEIYEPMSVLKLTKRYVVKFLRR